MLSEWKKQGKKGTRKVLELAESCEKSGAASCVLAAALIYLINRLIFIFHVKTY